MPEERPPPRNSIERLANFAISIFDGPVTWVRGKYLSLPIFQRKPSFFNYQSIKIWSNENHLNIENLFNFNIFFI